MNYYELEPEDSNFNVVLVQTTYMCQMKCSNCYLGDMLNDKTIPNVDYRRLKNVLSRLPHSAEVRFLGAEPTLNPELPSLIKVAKNSGHIPSMVSNGLRLSVDPYVKSLKESGISHIGISMNGGLEDSVYKIFDNGNYATQKSMALENCFKYKIYPHINIIVTPLNLHVIAPLIDRIVKLSMKYGVKLGNRFPVILRPKSVGQMGNFLETKSYTLDELTEVMANVTGVTVDYINSNSLSKSKAWNFLLGGEKNTKLFRLKTEAGDIICKITDWNVDDDGIIDGGSTRRGIITKDYKIAPAFEYYAREVNSYGS